MKRDARILFNDVLVFMLGVACIGHVSAVAAQPAAVKAEAGDVFRAAYATSADVADGKRVAEASCAGCHGANGISVTSGVPHLAGQRPVYMHVELRAYQSGARGDSAMNAAVKFLNDDALFKVAAYYASLDPAPPAVAGGAKAAAGKPDSSAPGKGDPVQAGKAAAAPCAGCHGDGGVTRTPGMPSLVGLDPKYLVAAMKSYRSGQRKHELMKAALAASTDADLDNIALYYAMQKPVRAPTPLPGDQAAGKIAAAACASCHGARGVSPAPADPSLAGQDAQYLVAALKAYKDGSRAHEMMKAAASALDDAGTINVAAFYAAQTPQAPKVTKPLSIAELAQKCDRCHGTDGNSTDPRLPTLAAQRVEYLEKVLTAYRTGTRKSPQMAAMSAVLGEVDVQGLAAHYARQKARSVVYVLLPSR